MYLVLTKLSKWQLPMNFERKESRSQNLHDGKKAVSTRVVGHQKIYSKQTSIGRKFGGHIVGHLGKKQVERTN